MVEIPKALRSLFSATVHERDGGYVVELPRSEVENGAVAVGETYRVAVFDAAEDPGEREPAPATSRSPGAPEPPVDEGEVRDVTIEAVGDQGDGIAKVERGYVVIVPGAVPGDEPTVEIEQVRQNVAFARVLDADER